MKKLSYEQIKENIHHLQNFMQFLQIDYFYVSSFDPYLTEYVPLEDCHRYYVTGFSGSVAHALVPASGKALLFVDGRYHQQADLEVSLDDVEVIKAPYIDHLEQAVFNYLTTKRFQHLAIEGNRTPLSIAKRFEAMATVTSFDENELWPILSWPAKKPLNPIKKLSSEHWGLSTEEKLQRILADDKEAIFITALDSIAWLSNCRGYHSPTLSSFYAKAIATKGKLYVFYDHHSTIEEDLLTCNSIQFIPCQEGQLYTELTKLNLDNLSKVYFDPESITFADFAILNKVFGPKIFTKNGGLIPFHSQKSSSEIEFYKEAFQHSDRAIYKTIQWMKEKVKSGDKVSELLLHKKTWEYYKEEGALALSFNTISSIAENTSIIHFGNPSGDVIANKDDLVLLDSGGYFAAGVATDCTRTFIAGDAKPNEKHREMYTLVLQGFLRASKAIFPKETSGQYIDSLARSALFEKGFNYQHGTGHGVGVHVHEGGVRLAPNSQLPMRAGQIVSIEPGVYFPGIGGVRIENIAIVKEHNELPGYLYFEPLVYLGLEHSLIDESLLSTSELDYLTKYEAECVKRGTSFK